MLCGLRHRWCDHFVKAWKRVGMKNCHRFCHCCRLPIIGILSPCGHLALLFLFLFGSSDDTLSTNFRLSLWRQAHVPSSIHRKWRKRRQLKRLIKSNIGDRRGHGVVYNGVLKYYCDETILKEHESRDDETIMMWCHKKSKQTRFFCSPFFVSPSIVITALTDNDVSPVISEFVLLWLDHRCLSNFVLKRDPKWGFWNGIGAVRLMFQKLFLEPGKCKKTPKN